MNNPTANKRLPLFGVVAAAVLAWPFLLRWASGNQYLVIISCFALVYIIAVNGLDILFGYSGQISLGHAAFFAIGGYTTAMLNKYFSMPVYVTIPVAAILASAIGALLAYPAAKLKFHFLSLATIAFGEIVLNTVNVSPGGVTGDNLGLRVAGIGVLSDATRWYFFLLFFVVLALVAKTSLVKSRVGRAFMAIRENTHAADGMGVNVHKYKIIAFAVSAFYTGFAGALYAHFMKYMNPNNAELSQSVLFLTMLLFGGTASILGPIFGVVLITILMELIRPLQEYQMLFFGVLLLIVIMALPGGIYGGIKDLNATLKNRKLWKADQAGQARKGGE